MFTVEYVFSTDPLVGLIQKSPWEIFGRPYAAYIIFLFGEADPHASAWIRNNLVALDSMTGPEIAGVIFAKSVTIKARLESGRGGARRQRGIAGTERRIEIGEVITDEPWRAEPMFPDNISRPWEGPIRGRKCDDRSQLVDVVATTYASDELARHFGVFADVPCIILVDALPSSGFEVIRLDDAIFSGLAKLLRTTIGRFTGDAGFARKKTELEELRLTLAEISSLEGMISRSACNLQAQLQAIDTAGLAALEYAKLWLGEGSIKRFSQGLQSSALVDRHEIESAIRRAGLLKEQLSRLAKTIASLTWYAETRAWPLIDDDIHRVNGIVEGHASALLSYPLPVGLAWTKAILREHLDALIKLRHGVVERVWQGLPDLAEISRQQNARSEEILAAHSHQLHVNQTRAEKLRTVAAELIKSVAGNEASIVRAYREGESRALAHATARSVGPPPDELLVALLRNSTVNLSTGDVYMATNVAAMGPGSSAQNVTIQSES
ncbi:hypothetical protein [Sinorhizobium meliloti]|uniref:hypothetical protein n=1 Tax=Rhizobium meliloti TaxID=382 RepID=UPI0012971225|nr:hypothetical protein [Sinorhizobium meliloti]MQW55278.1 hypothetical protein [Sinorhizobium meliloti]